MLFGGLSMEDAIRLYFEKQDALKRGDLVALSKLRQTAPTLFHKKTEEDIKVILAYVTALQRLPDFKQRYADFLRQKTKNSLSVITDHPF